MPNHLSLRSIVRKNLLELSSRPRPSPGDPFRPLAKIRRPRAVALPLSAAVGPGAANKPNDVAGVARALELATGNERGGRSIFDARLDTGVRNFQSQNRLKADWLLNPAGPTIRALGRVLARPPLQGLSGAAVSANGRLVSHLKTTTEDGLVPELMATDFRANEAGRAKTADFLSQLFARDKDRARSLRAKAGSQMSNDEKNLLDRLIIQARLADEPDEPDETPDDPGQDDGGEDDEPPFDPEHPRPGDPDDPEPDEPEEPEKPKPDCDDLILEVSEAGVARIKALQHHSEIAEKLGTVTVKIFQLKDKIAELEFKLSAAATGKLISRFPHFLTRVAGGLSTAAAIELRAQLSKARNELEKKQEELKSLEAELETATTEMNARERELEEAKARLKECQQG